jgi:hypothetical protein
VVLAVIWVCGGLCILGRRGTSYWSCDRATNLFAWKHTSGQLGSVQLWRVSCFVAHIHTFDSWILSYLPLYPLSGQIAYGPYNPTSHLIHLPLQPASYIPACLRTHANSNASARKSSPGLSSQVVQAGKRDAGFQPRACEWRTWCGGVGDMYIRPASVCGG